MICIWGKRRNNTQKRRNQMKQYNKIIPKVINYDDVTKEYINKHNPNWPQISDDLYRIRGT